MTETATATVAPKPRPYFSIGDKTLAISENDPRMIRWGINPGSTGCNPPILDTGISPIPVGHPFPITTFEKSVENCTTDENEPRTKLETVTAQIAENNIAMYLNKLGFRTFAIGETNEDLMALYKEALLPNLSEIGVRCPSMDEADLGNRDYCPQCLYQFLTSDDCGERIGVFSKQYKDLNSEQIMQLRRVFIEAYSEYITTAREVWNGIVRDYETGQQTQIAGQQHQLRKNIHEVKPADKQVALLGEAAKIQSQQTNESTAALIAYLDEKAAEREQRFAERQMEMMAALLERLAPLSEKKK